MPEVEACMYLVDVLFKVGPVRSDSALTEADLEPWERRRGIELQPWQAELVVSLSREYMMEMHAAKHWNALCPWKTGRGMWKYVQDQRSMQTAPSEPIKEKPSGSRKRH